MKHSPLRCFSFVLIVLNISIPFWVNAEFDDDSWMQPDTWNEEHLTSITNNNEQCCKCAETGPESQVEHHQNVPKFTEDGVGLMYLRRWMLLIFDRKKLMEDRELQKYERTLTFSITPSQLDKIENWKDPRDLDEIITEIFVKASNKGCDDTTKTPGIVTRIATGLKTLVVNMLVYLRKFTTSTEIQFILMAALVAICVWFLHRHYLISYIPLLVGGGILFGYLHTYLECNRELQINEMLEALDMAESKAQQSGFMGFLRRMFSSSNDNRQRQQLRQSAKIKLGFCRPDHVAIMYFNDVFMNFLQVLIEKCVSSAGVLKMGLPFPFDYLAAPMLFCLIAYLLKLIFKYLLGPAAWGFVWHRSPQHHPYATQTAALHQGDANLHNADRITGDNLKTLLNILHITTERVRQIDTTKVAAVSGVEEVRESIESAPANDVSSTGSISNSDTSVKSPCKCKKNNNDASKEEPMTNNIDVTVEDLPDDL